MLDERAWARRAKRWQTTAILSLGMTFVVTWAGPHFAPGNHTVSIASSAVEFLLLSVCVLAIARSKARRPTPPPPRPKARRRR